MRRKNLFQDRRGEGYIDTALMIVIVFTLMISLMFVFSIFTTYLGLNSTAKQLAHGIEVYGQADDATIAMISGGELSAADVQVDTTWYNSARRTIQLKTPFTVTVHERINIPILKFITGDAVNIKLNLSASADGISEVYWKAGT